MRTLLALMLVMGAVIPSNATAQQAMPMGKKSENANSKRAAKPSDTAARQPSNEKRLTDEKERLECDRARNEDPTGLFAGYPCWAREVFGRTQNPTDSGGE
jgi:hypothetical protein